MRALDLLLFRSDSMVDYAGKRKSFPANTMVIVPSSNVNVTGATNDSVAVRYNTGHFQTLYGELKACLMPIEGSLLLEEAPLKPIQLAPEIINLSMKLCEQDKSLLLKFTYLHALAADPHYFSRLLHHFVSGSREIFDFIEEHCTSGYSVRKLAAKIGMPTHKLNLIFEDNFGVSLKTWMRERRLEKSRELLLSSSMRVSDIAMECGFSSHAHFSDSFKKRYAVTPRHLRMGTNTI